jgi:hypothetical protein
VATGKAIDLNALREDCAYTAEGLEMLKATVEDFLKATGMSQTVFGYEAAGQVDFVRLLRKDRDFRTSTVVKVLKWIARYEAAPIG